MKSNVVEAKIYDIPKMKNHYMLVYMIGPNHWRATGRLHLTVDEAWQDMQVLSDYSAYKMVEIPLPMELF